MNILKRLKCAAAIGLTLASAMFATDAAATAASFTTTNMGVDGPGHCYNGGTSGDPVNCNIYDAKPSVWMNGGPIGEAVGPGQYYFVIFQPSGQSNPRDGSDNLLSYDTGGDPYTNRSFTINLDLSITYNGNHDVTGKMIRLGLNPDGAGPNLDDWYETTPNSGGEYHLGICRLNADGTQRTKDSCKFDAFKLVHVQPPVCDANHPELCPPVCDEAHPDLCVCDAQHPELCPQCECGGTFPDCKSCAVGPILNASKTADGSYDRNINWGITKSINGPVLRYLGTGGSTTVDYQVVVTKTESVTNVKVVGDITVANSGDEVAAATVTDTLDSSFNNLVCDITDPSQFALIVVSSSATSGYVCTLPDGLPNDLGTNTATVDYMGRDLNGDPEAKSTSAFVGFGFTETLTGSDCATMSDLFNGVTTVAIGEGSTCTGGTFTYSKTINAASGCVDYPNVASVTPDGGQAITDGEMVTVCAPVQSGALSKGFWHNKNGQGRIKNSPAPGGVCSVYTNLEQYAPFAGVKGTDKTCAGVAAWVLTVIDGASSAGAAMNSMLRAQMLAAALDYHVLGANFNFNLTYPNNKSAAFGGASCMMIPDMLKYASGNPNAAIYIGPVGPAEKWYNQVKGTQGLAKDAFESIAIETAYECP